MQKSKVCQSLQTKDSLFQWIRNWYLINVKSWWSLRINPSTKIHFNVEFWIIYILFVLCIYIIYWYHITRTFLQKLEKWFNKSLFLVDIFKMNHILKRKVLNEKVFLVFLWFYSFLSRNAFGGWKRVLFWKHHWIKFLLMIKGFRKNEC